MDTFGSIHACLSNHGKELSCAELAHGDVPAQIARVLKDCGHARPQRRCPLRPDVVLWLVLAMVLHRGLSIPNVFAHLLASWRRCRLPSLLRPVSDGALAHARERLGVKPLQRLFEVLASQVHPPATFHGRRVWAIDGSRVDLPDTPANVKWFQGGRRNRRAGCPGSPPHAPGPLLARDRVRDMAAGAAERAQGTRDPPGCIAARRSGPAGPGLLCGIDAGACRALPFADEFSQLGGNRRGRRRRIGLRGGRHRG